jgi:hypothetical protein
MNRLPRSLRVAGILAVAASVTVPAAAAHAAKGRGKPDLAITAARVTGKQYAFKGDRFSLKVTAWTKNLRTRRNHRRAGPTLTRIYLRHGGDRYELDQHAVPGLAPGADDQAEVRVVTRNRYPAGEYRVEICADVKSEVREADEDNNCTTARSFRHVYSAYYGYIGTAGGTGPGPTFNNNTSENWRHSQRLAFVWSGQYIAGAFRYEPEGGTVRYTTQGTDNNCHFSGSRTLRLAAKSTITVDWHKETYVAAVSPAGHYRITNDCDPGNRISGPLTNVVFQTGLLSPTQLRFGSRSLNGAEQDPLLSLPGLPVNYTWNLAGAFP